ncbi:hypothetical protein V5O48_004511 [Marasmius crinis-equi]|uniref:HECT domain-containing protein n=1 Tax=Marasmius crinis-equi TaxID=585013 RepID=A0ABR3FQN1_9AGAR
MDCGGYQENESLPPQACTITFENDLEAHGQPAGNGTTPMLVRRILRIPWGSTTQSADAIWNYGHMRPLCFLALPNGNPSLPPVTQVWQRGPTANDGRVQHMALERLRHSATLSVFSSPITTTPTTQVSLPRDGRITALQASQGINGRLGAAIANARSVHKSTPVAPDKSGLPKPQELPDGTWRQDYIVILLTHSLDTHMDEMDNLLLETPKSRPTVYITSRTISSLLKQSQKWGLFDRLTLKANNLSESYTDSPFKLLVSDRARPNGRPIPFKLARYGQYDTTLNTLDKVTHSKHFLNEYERIGVLVFSPSYRLNGPLESNGPIHRCFAYRFHLLLSEVMAPPIDDAQVDQICEEYCAESPSTEANAAATDGSSPSSSSSGVPVRRSPRLASSSSSSAASPASISTSLPSTPEVNVSHLPHMQSASTSLSPEPENMPPPPSPPTQNTSTITITSTQNALPTVSAIAGERVPAMWWSRVQRLAGRSGTATIPRPRCVEITAPTTEKASEIMLSLLLSHHAGDTAATIQRVLEENNRGYLLSYNMMRTDNPFSEQEYDPPVSIDTFDFDALGFGNRTWRIGTSGSRAVGGGPEKQILEQTLQLALKTCPRGTIKKLDAERGLMTWDFRRLPTPEREKWAKLFGTLMALYFLWNDMTAYPLSPFLYSLLHSSYRSLLEPNAIKSLDDVTAVKWAKWPLDKPDNGLLSDNDPLNELRAMILSHVPGRQMSAFIDASQEEWNEATDDVLSSLCFDTTSSMLDTTVDINNIREGANLIISSLTGTKFLQVFTPANGHALTRAMIGGLLPSPDVLINNIDWEVPDASFINVERLDGVSIAGGYDSARNPYAARFQSQLDAYLQGRGHPQKLIGPGCMFDQQADTTDPIFRASLFLRVATGTQLVPIKANWKILVRIVGLYDEQTLNVIDQLRFCQNPNLQAWIDVHTCASIIDIKLHPQLVAILENRDQDEFDAHFHAALWASSDFNTL